jgi:hypothetical protein
VIGVVALVGDVRGEAFDQFVREGDVVSLGPVSRSGGAGFSSASPAARILAPKPPRERRRPWASPPFFAASADSLLMRPRDGRIDHQLRKF